MQIHCDHCGKLLEATLALKRDLDGETLCFCSEACATAACHLADDPWADDDGSGVGPAIAGDLDDPPPKAR